MNKIVLFFLVSCGTFSFQMEKEVYKKESPSYYCEVEIPKILIAEKKEQFNKKMNEKVKKLILKDYVLGKYDTKMERKVTYEIFNSNIGISSIVFSEYEYNVGDAHGYTTKEAYLLDEKTGNILNINNYLSFKEKKKIRDKIKSEMKKNPNIYFLDSKIDLRDAIIYFNDDKIVIEFGMYKIAPYSTGIPKFEFIKKEIQ